MPEQPRQSVPVLDSATNRIGVVRDTFTKAGRPAVWLRPVNGGPEWTTFRDDLRALPPTGAAT